MPKSKKPGKNTSSGNKPYTRASKKKDADSNLNNTTPGTTGNKPDKNQEWCSLLNKLDQNYNSLNPIPKDTHDPKNIPTLNSVFQKKQDTPKKPTPSQFLTVYDIVNTPKNDIDDKSDSDDEDYEPELDDSMDLDEPSTNELSTNEFSTNELSTNEDDLNEPTTNEDDLNESATNEDDLNESATNEDKNGTPMDESDNDTPEDDMQKKVSNCIVLSMSIKKHGNNDDKSKKNASKGQSKDQSKDQSPTGSRKRKLSKTSKKSDIKNTKPDNDNDEDDDDENQDIMKIFFPVQKKRKLSEKDREYQTLISHKEPDLIDHFITLSEETKDRIITEEKYIIDNYYNEEPLRIRVINSTLPPQIKAEILKKMDSSSSVFGSNNKLMTWINNIMSVPWGKLYSNPVSMSETPDQKLTYISDVYNRMDKAVYGHKEAKCHIVQIISKWISNPSSVGNCLALQGPMGVGKTTLVKEGLAPALGRPFNFISLGGATDSSFLDGHSYTYEGSRPGQIVEVIQRSGCMNPIIYFDELDKISKSAKGDEVANMLVHLTDTQQNDCFHDKYFGNINIDLSKAFFVFSYNDESLISPILRDRLQVIKVKGYNVSEKTEIAKHYMIPRFAKQLGFSENQIQIKSETVSYISNVYADKEEGVRNLGRELETLMSRLNVIRLIQDSASADKDVLLEKLPFKATLIPHITPSFEITKEIVDNILTKPVKDESWRFMYT
jgi:ATP-dependent Lon protease